MHTFFGGCCRGWYFQNERAPAVPVKGAGGQWLGLWEAARSSPAATHYYTDPLKSPTSFHSSSQKSNQLPYFLSKSNHTFHTSSQKSINLPYCLSKVQPPSIPPLKRSTSPFWHVGCYFFYKNGRSWKINPKVPNRLSCWGLKKGHWRNPIAKTDIRAEIRIFGTKKTPTS